MLLCASLAFAQYASTPGRTQTPAPAQPTPTPYVRPRKVTPKVDAAQPQPASPQTATPQSATPARPADAAPSQPSQPPAGQDAEVVDEDEVVRVDSNLVIIPASVVDARGRAIGDLKVEDFELKVDGEVKPIGELTRAETPVHVALLFDNSYSLSAAREFEKQAAVRFFRSVVRPIDRAAVYSVSTTPRLAQGMTTRFESTRTTSSSSTSSGACDGADCGCEAGAGAGVVCGCSDGTGCGSVVSFGATVRRGRT